MFLKDVVKLFVFEISMFIIISNMKYIENCWKKFLVLVVNLLLKWWMVMFKMIGIIDILISFIIVWIIEKFGVFFFIK